MRNTFLLCAAGLILACGAPDSSSFNPTPASPLPEVQGTAYDLDNQHSHVMFQVGHLGISRQYGRFGEVAGSFMLADDPKRSWVWIAMDPASVDTNVPARDKHIRSADFFNVRQYPDLRFQSTSVAPGSDGTYAITGDLEFHGVTREITFDMTKTGEGEFGEYGERVAFEGGFTLDRFDYGIEGYPDVVGREIQIDLVVEGTKR